MKFPVGTGADAVLPSQGWNAFLRNLGSGTSAPAAIDGIGRELSSDIIQRIMTKSPSAKADCGLENMEENQP